MKRVHLIKTIEGFGCVLIRHGAKHDWYRNPNTGVSQPVPRQREIKEHLAKLVGPAVPDADKPATSNVNRVRHSRTYVTAGQ